MRKIKDLYPGKIIGKRTILSRLQSTTNNSMWKFVCSCGSTGEATGSALRRSSGCRSCAMEDKRKEYGDSSFNSLYLRYKHGAQSRNLKFLLTKEQFKVLTSSACYYCKATPKNIHKAKTGHGEYVYNGVDRRDSSRDYGITNCVTCCSICNRAKASISEAEFLEWINNLIRGQNEF